MRSLPLLLLLATTAAAQSPLTTTFANNNFGSVGNTVYFDLSYKKTFDGVSITQLHINLKEPLSSTGTIDVYLAAGTSLPITSGNWVLWAAGLPVTAVGPGLETEVDLDIYPIPLGPGCALGVALVATDVTHTYTNGANTFETDELKLIASTVSNTAFVGPIMPRTVNTKLTYAITTVESCPSLASNTTVGMGCYLPTPLTLTGQTRPVQPGLWNLHVSNIPTTALFGLHWFGLSDPTILDLSPGMPDCQLRASPDVVIGPWLAVPTTHDYSLWIPPSPNLEGFEVYTQAAVFVPNINPSQLISSNGVLGTIGIY